MGDWLLFGSIMYDKSSVADGDIIRNGKYFLKLDVSSNRKEIFGEKLPAFSS